MLLKHENVFSLMKPLICGGDRARLLSILHSVHAELCEAIKRGVRIFVNSAIDFIKNPTRSAPIHEPVFYTRTKKFSIELTAVFVYLSKIPMQSSFRS